MDHYVRYIETLADFNRLRANASNPPYPETESPPASVQDLIEREYKALGEVFRREGFKGGRVKGLDRAVNLHPDGWTNYVLTIEDRDVPRTKETAWEIVGGKSEYHFLFDLDWKVFPKHYWERLAMRQALGTALKFDQPCQRCYGHGCFTPDGPSYSRRGRMIGLLGDMRRPCFRCLGYKVDPEFFDDLQVEFGMFWDDPAFPVPTLANNEWNEYFPSLKQKDEYPNYGNDR